MQVNGRTAIWGQTDFAADGKKKTVSNVSKNTVSAAQNGKEKELSLVAWQADDPANENTENYVPSDEGMLELYLKQLEQMQADNENAQGAQDDEIKALRIAHNIMRGMKVPSKDESFLLTKNFKLYMAAKNIASMKECKGKAKSELDGSESGTLADASGSAADGAGTNGSFSWNAAVTNRTTSGIYSSSKTKYKKKRKRFHYNFKDVSAQIVNAKTSGSARQVLARAKQKTATLRKKLRIGEYDDELVMMAITHAEAMERVAKKKMKHLQEEERAQRAGGPCEGDTTREDIKEQQRQDEQMYMQMEQAQQGTPVEMFDMTDGQSIEELLADAISTDFSMPDITADMMQDLFYSMDETMIDLTGSMSELMDDFSDMMQETLEDMGGLEELAEELLGDVEHTIDPEDLKRKKTKHRTEEQRAIAEAMNDGGGMLSFVGTQTPSASEARTAASPGESGGSIDAAVPEVAAVNAAQAAPTPKAAISGAAPVVGAVVDVSIGD